MSDILCIYYSRTGHTKQAMEEIAQALNAELVEITDGVDRGRTSGLLRSGLDAMARTTAPLQPFETERPLEDYRLVVVGTPVWAGRCSSVVRGLLKKHGKKLTHAAYVATRGTEKRDEDLFAQMDLYVPAGHEAAVSLRVGSVGYEFWQEEFLRQVREFLNRK